jgi:hypothetical protein
LPKSIFAGWRIDSTDNRQHNDQSHGNVPKPLITPLIHLCL